MKVCVVDASLMVAALTDPGPEGSWALKLLGEYDLFGPELVLIETTNVMRRLEFAGRLDPVLAEFGRRHLLDLSITLVPFHAIAERVWDLRANVTGYDACCVALAETLEAPLATLDQRLTQATGPRCEFLHPW